MIGCSIWRVSIGLVYGGISFVGCHAMMQSEVAQQQTFPFYAVAVAPAMVVSDAGLEYKEIPVSPPRSQWPDAWNGSNLPFFLSLRIERQLIENERVCVIGEKELQKTWWYEVELLEMMTGTPGSEKPCRGWVKAEAVRKVDSFATPSLVVITPVETYGVGVADVWVLSPGACYAIVQKSDQEYEIILHNGCKATVVKSACSLLSECAQWDEARMRQEVVARARVFLGAPYGWGCKRVYTPGTLSSTDCSGVNILSFRMVGMQLPENAHSQWAHAKPIRGCDLKPGDLIFMRKNTSTTGRIAHVVLMTGEGKFIEASASGGDDGISEKIDTIRVGLELKTIHETECDDAAGAWHMFFATIIGDVDGVACARAAMQCVKY